LVLAAGCAGVENLPFGADDIYIHFDTAERAPAGRDQKKILPQTPLSAAGAVKIALGNNPDIKIARRNIEIASDRINQARGSFLPKISAFGNRTLKDRIPAYEVAGQKMSFGEKGTGLYGASMTVPIYDFGRSEAGYRQALLSREVEKVKTVRVTQEVILTVKDTFFQLQKLKNVREVVENTIAQLKEHEKHTEQFLKNGLVDRSALLSMQVKIAEVQQQRIKVENGIRNARAALNQILNLDLDFDTQTKSEEWSDFKEFSEKGCAELALHSRPEILELKNQKELAKASLSAAKAERYPTLSAVGSYNYQDDASLAAKDFWQAQLSLEIPIWSGGRTTAKVREAEKFIEQADENNRKMLQGIHLQVKSACSSIEEAVQRIVVGEKAVASAQENLRILANKYQNQVIAATDLLDGEVALAASESELIQAKYDYLQALAALEYAVGREARDLPTKQQSTREGEKSETEK
jgi:outer membrane protein TolC